jgi:serine protease Do
MKQYFLKTAGSMLLLSLMTAGAMAQQDEKGKDKEKSKVSSNDVIIVRPKTEKDSKVVIEVKDGEVTVNGKPLAEFKDDDITISRRKEVAGVLATAPSRFRGGSGGTTWSFDNNMNNLNMRLGQMDVFNSNGAFLGVSTDKEDGGAKITAVTKNTAAEKAGLKKADVIVKLDEVKIESPEDLTRAVGKHKPEDKVTVTIKRDGKEQKIPATLGKRTGTYSLNLGNNNAYNYSYAFGRGRLGLKAQETEDSKGLKVLEVDEESIAQTAGIKEDDIILEFDGTAVNDIDKLREVSRPAMEKGSFKVKVLRNGKTEELTVKIPKNLKTTNL